MKKFKLVIYYTEAHHDSDVLIDKATDCYFDNIKDVERSTYGLSLGHYHVEELITVNIGHKRLNLWSVLDE
jgi:hypothetical protein